MYSLNTTVFSPTAVCMFSIEQRVNYSQSAGNVSDWAEVVAMPATTSDSLHIARVTVSNEYSNLEYRIVCNWLDFGKTLPGRASPSSDVVKPATYCISKSCVHMQAACVLFMCLDVF